MERDKNPKFVEDKAMEKIVDMAGHVCFTEDQFESDCKILVEANHQQRKKIEKHVW